MNPRIRIVLVVVLEKTRRENIEDEGRVRRREYVSGFMNRCAKRSEGISALG
jgi:hypothetical protein